MNALFCALLLALSQVSGGRADFVTYEWLIECAIKSAYTDHIPHFKRLFGAMKVRGFLECGCGYSSKYFMDHCDRVVSIEMMSPGTSDVWFKECLELYEECENWFPIAYNSDHRDESFGTACTYACVTHKDYSLIDARYLKSLDRLFKAQMKASLAAGHEIDVAFVDPGVYTRGDMVKVLLENEIPVVVAHDTACDPGPDAEEGLYNWFVVKTTPHYEKIHIPFGQGTTFWIKKSLPDIIASISAYRDKIVQEKEQMFDTISYIRLLEIADAP
jgi:hypothetical protein